MRTISYILLLAFFAVSCASKPKNSFTYERINDNPNRMIDEESQLNLLHIKDIPQFEHTKDLIAPGFLFSLHHPSDEKLQGRYRVTTDGILRLPYGIVIDTEGMTYADLRSKVLNAFKNFFQKGVQDISFRLLKKEYYVEVRGLVKNSGHYLVDRNESIDKVIDKAGGIKGNLQEDFFIVSLKQMDKSYSISLNQYFENSVFSSAFTWTGRDTLFVNLLNDEGLEDAVPTVSVIGGVQNPGKALYHENANIFYYLGKSGGVMPNLGYKEAYVFRNTVSGLKKIQFDITDPSTIPVIKPNDVIMLNGEKRTAMDKIFERATQIGAIISSIAILILAF